MDNSCGEDPSTVCQEPGYQLAVEGPISSVVMYIGKKQQDINPFCNNFLSLLSARYSTRNLGKKGMTWSLPSKNLNFSEKNRHVNTQIMKWHGKCKKRMLCNYRNSIKEEVTNSQKLEIKEWMQFILHTSGAHGLRWISKPFQGFNMRLFLNWVLKDE